MFGNRGGLRDKTSKAAGGLDALHDALDQHLLANYLDLVGAPLMLCVCGKPGIGKSHAIKKHLAARFVDTREISSSALSHHLEGVALKPLIRAYRDASDANYVRSAAVLIDDIDRSTISIRDKSIGHTVHTQLLTGFLMDLCDNPRQVVSEDVGATRTMVETDRVPVVLTANSVLGLDAALTRPQRMRVFTFDPTVADRLAMIAQIMRPSDGPSVALLEKDLAQLERQFRAYPVAFFADLYARLLAEAIPTATIARLLSHKEAVLDIQTRREALKAEMGGVISGLNAATVMAKANALAKEREYALGAGKDGPP